MFTKLPAHKIWPACANQSQDMCNNGPSSDALLMCPLWIFSASGPIVTQHTDSYYLQILGYRPKA
eukprot:352983-Chlamydomonas_euryale.AAC.3